MLGSWYRFVPNYPNYIFERRFTGDGVETALTHVHHFDPPSGKWVLDSVAPSINLYTYSLDGDLIRRTIRTRGNDTAMTKDCLRFSLAGDSLSLWQVGVYTGTSATLEGRWRRDAGIYSETLEYTRDEYRYYGNGDTVLARRKLVRSDDSTVTEVDEKWGNTTFRYKIVAGELQKTFIGNPSVYRGSKPILPIPKAVP